MKLRVYAFLLLGSSCVANAQWTQLGTQHSLPSNMEKIEVIGITGTKVVISTTLNGIFLSENNGDIWRKPGGAFPATAHFYGTATLNGKLFFGSAAPYVGIYVSSDNGESWDSLSNGTIENTSIRMLGAFNGKLFASGSKLFVSEDSGSTWQNSSSGLPPFDYVQAAAFLGNTYYCSSSKVYKSTDGIAWEAAANIGIPASTQLTKLLSTGDILVCYASGNCIYYSEDNGENWTASTGMSDNDKKAVRDIIVHEGKLYASTSAFIYISNDNGKTWSYLDESGIRPMGATVLAAVNSTLFAGINTASPNGAFFKRALTPTSVQMSDGKIPQQFSLSQNYPNPFNPSTAINFTVQVSSFTTLKVYDIVGREVALLVSEILAAGKYDVKYDASKLSSGIYFYRLQAGSFSETKRMILLK